MSGRLIKPILVRFLGPGMLALFVSLFGQSVGAHAASIAITGTVTDPNNNPVQGVSITATDPAGTVEFGPVLSGSDGSYELDVDLCTYTLRFVPPTSSGLGAVADANFSAFASQEWDVQLNSATYFTLSGQVSTVMVRQQLPGPRPLAVAASIS